MPVPITPDMKRFDIFLIDTGWNRPISGWSRSHLPLIYRISEARQPLPAHRRAVGRGPQARPGPDRPRPDDHLLRLLRFARRQATAASGSTWA